MMQPATSHLQSTAVLSCTANPSTPTLLHSYFLQTSKLAWDLVSYLCEHSQLQMWQLCADTSQHLLWLCVEPWWELAQIRRPGARLPEISKVMSCDLSWQVCHGSVLGFALLSESMTRPNLAQHAGRDGQDIRSMHLHSTNPASPLASAAPDNFLMQLAVSHADRNCSTGSTGFQHSRDCAA